VCCAHALRPTSACARAQAERNALIALGFGIAAGVGFAFAFATLASRTAARLVSEVKSLNGSGEIDGDDVDAM
jgi:hypothetical protein